MTSISSVGGRLRAGLALFFCVWIAAAAQDFDDAGHPRIQYPGWFVDSPFLDLKEHLDSAVANGKQGLMILFTTEGCSYCGAFIDRSLGDPDLAARVRQHFDAIGLEIFDDAEMTAPDGSTMRVKHFADAQGAGYSPTLLFFDASGEVAARAVGYQPPERFGVILNYVSGGHYRDVSLSRFLKNGGALLATGQGGLRPDPLFSKPPYVLDRSRFAAARPLLVLFEQPGCSDCDAFHEEVLALEEVRELMRRFEVVRLDATDAKTPVLDPRGDRVTPASWFERTGFSRLPALLFFDEAGNQVLDTDAVVLRQRMLNSLSYVLERAYEKRWTYQRFARSKAIERNAGP